MTSPEYQLHPHSGPLEETRQEAGKGPQATDATQARENAPTNLHHAFDNPGKHPEWIVLSEILDLAM